MNKNDSINIRVLELLSSRICHDLISPVSAINNGIELYEELGEAAGDEVRDLIAYSAKQTARKLQHMRFAYGAGGNDPSIKPFQVFDAFQGFLDGDGKTKLEPPSPDRQMPMAGRPAINRILACVLLLAHETMPRGGTIVLSCGEDSMTFDMDAVDSGLWRKFKDKVFSETLTRMEGELDPRTIHPYVTGLFLREYGYETEFSEGEEQKASIKIVFPEREDD